MSFAATTTKRGATVGSSQTLRIGSLDVRRMGFGTMQLTGPGVWGPPADPANAIQVLRRAVERGVNLIDTADSYGPDVAEELVRDALYPYPAGVTVATKAGYLRPGPGEWQECGRPEYLRSQCEASLKRLGVDHIDLFQLHRIDPRVPVEDQFGALKDLRDAGLVTEVGLSEVGVSAIQHARDIVPIASVQNHYNIGQRSADDVVDYCEASQIGFIPWFPLGSGKLSREGGPLDAVARELRATVSQVSLAWLLRRSPVMLPIPGTSSLDHLEENCAAGALELSDTQYAALTDARKPLRRWALAG